MKAPTARAPAAEETRLKTLSMVAVYSCRSFVWYVVLLLAAQVCREHSWTNPGTAAGGAWGAGYRPLSFLSKSQTRANALVTKNTMKTLVTFIILS